MLSRISNIQHKIIPGMDNKMTDMGTDIDTKVDDMWNNI